MLSPNRFLTEQTYPTLLRTPDRYSLFNVRILPGRASDYITEEVHPGWVLVVTIEGGLVYFGPGQASVVRSPCTLLSTKRRSANDPLLPFGISELMTALQGGSSHLSR